MDLIFDRNAIRLHRERALRIADQGAAFLLERVSEEVAERLSMVQRRFDNVKVTSGNGSLVVTGLTETGEEALQPQWPMTDEETPFEGEPTLDLALSLLTLHETNDTPGALIHIRKRLKPDGLFMGVMAGAGTLQELRECWLEAETELIGGARPRVYPFADVRAAGSLMQRAGFALPVIDEEKVTVRYADMFALMRDLRAMGSMSALASRAKTLARRDVMLRAAAIYQEKFAQQDGRIPATFNFIYLSGWAPDASQQKPARRGSATMSLETALKLGSNDPISRR